MDQFEIDGGFDGSVHNEEYFYIHGKDAKPFGQPWRKARKVGL